MNATTRLVPLAAQPVMPWANGGGSTREVAIEPPGASLARGFAWRVSIAQVATDGPFSRLPGVDRMVWLLRGDGLRLDVGGRDALLAPGAGPIEFAGETAVSGQLLGGACEDLNVMVARAWGRAAAQLVELAPGAALVVAAAPQRLLLAAAGAFDVDPGWRVGERDALRFDGGGAVRAVAGAAGCTLLAASFRPV